MTKGGRNQQTARAGEYYVAAELNRRGAYAVTFAGNMPKTDILASDCNQNRTVSIQVKSRRTGTWQCSIKDGGKCAMKDNETAFWIFVDLSKGKDPPDYYIVPDCWIRNNIYETRSAYLKKRFGKRAVTLDSPHHAIDHRRLVQWKNRWDILGIL
ncbi:MAG TPA: hypothetical protein VEF33_02725 [Syntrophales bacterium]|nr:hypothetical protein [Syntrophales bacterium]